MYAPGEELETVTFSSNPEKYFKIGQGLTSDDRDELVNNSFRYFYKSFSFSRSWSLLLVEEEPENERLEL
jgi:hypothetical protein